MWRFIFGAVVGAAAAAYVMRDEWSASGGRSEQKSLSGDASTGGADRMVTSVSELAGHVVDIVKANLGS